MSGAVFICGNPDRCPKHGTPNHGYPCWTCQEEWQATHPHMVAAIAAGKTSPASLRKAREADAALAEHSCAPTEGPSHD